MRRGVNCCVFVCSVCGFSTPRSIGNYYINSNHAAPGSWQRCAGVLRPATSVTARQRASAQSLRISEEFGSVSLAEREARWL